MQKKERYLCDYKCHIRIIWKNLWSFRKAIKLSDYEIWNWNRTEVTFIDKIKAWINLSSINEWFISHFLIIIQSRILQRQQRKKTFLTKKEARVDPYYRPFISANLIVIQGRYYLAMVSWLGIPRNDWGYSSEWEHTIILQ